MKKLFFILSIVVIWLIAVDLGARIVLPGGAPFAHEATLANAAPIADPLQYAGLQPSLDTTLAIPGLGESLPIQTNAYGFRHGPVQESKPEGVIRIIVLGSSFAFGWGVDQNQTFAAMLQDALNANSDTTYEVINASIPEASSFQLLKQYERVIHRMNADWLVIAPGPYDSFQARLSDEDVFTILDSHNAAAKPDGISAFLAYHSFMGGQWMNRSRAAAKETLDTRIAQQAGLQMWVPRCTDEQTRLYLNAMIEHHHSMQGKAILIDANILSEDSQPLLQSIADTHDIPLLTIRGLLERTAGRAERQFAFDNDLATSTFAEITGTSTLRFRVQAPPGHNHPVYISGDHTRLGGELPNRVGMRDDGREGDEKANDGVWSLQIDLSFTEPIRYQFTSDANGLLWQDTDTGFLRTAYNQRIKYTVEPQPWATHVSWTSIVHRLDVPPFASSLLSDQTRVPNANIHTTIANRLASLIEPSGS